MMKKNKAVLTYLKNHQEEISKAQHNQKVKAKKKKNPKIKENLHKQTSNRTEHAPINTFRDEYMPPKDRKIVSPSRKKFIRTISAIVICSVLIAVGVILSLTVFFKIETITVEGTKRFDTEKIINECGISYGENLFMCDKGSASKKIEQSNPYAERVDVSIHIPNQLDIKITEAKPSYVVVYNKKYYFVSIKNRILEIRDKNDETLPQIKGIKLSEEELGNYIKISGSDLGDAINDILTAVENVKMNEIKGIDVSSLESITINYDNRIKIKLGTEQKIEYKIKTAKKIIEDELDKNVKGVLDVSLVNGDSKQSSFLQDNTIFS